MEKRQDAENKNGRTVNGYIGTYFSENSRGVYRFSFDTENGRLTGPELFYEAGNAKWISLYGKRLAFPMEKNERAGTCFLHTENGEIKCADEILEERHAPCYILQEGNFAYTANYHDGTVMVYRMEKGKPELVNCLESGEGAGCHQVLLHESLLLLPCLEQNRIRLFDREKKFAPAGEISFPEGCGPRHGVFNRAHTRFYLVSEWSNELFVFQVKDGDFRPVQTLPLLREGGQGGAAAAIRLTRDEHFLYVSIRGENMLATVDVGGRKAFIRGYVSSGGVHPRDFILSPNERFVLTANRQEGGIVCRRRDTESGELREITDRIQMPEGVALAWEEQ